MGLTSKQQYLLRARSKEMHGEFEDRAKYFHCLNCGFVCNKERDIITDAPSVRPYGRLTTEDGYGMKTEDVPADIGLNGYDIYLENPSADVQLGCPFCGASWRK